MRNLSVGIDAGGTLTKIGLVDGNGEILRSLRIPTEPSRGPAHFARRITALLKDWSFGSVGLGLAGGVDPATGELLFVPNLKGWGGFSFRKAFRRSLGVPVVVENDANAAVWGGYAAALKRRPRTVVGVTLGTGVGGGLVIEGRLHRGATGSAGEIGHQTLELYGPRCHCGRRGCLEAYAGAYGIGRLAREFMRRPPSPPTPEAVAAAALDGDRGARRVWDEAGSRLGQGLANLVLVLNPDAVLLFGGVARAGKLVLDPIRRVFAAQSFRRPFQKTSLLALSNRDWGVVGAALLSRERRETSKC
ncbi:MAG: ROK family protein [Elusimicrobia bacterium]|nr:ROK family protein [Elusimicrobiota bacterium]